MCVCNVANLVLFTVQNRATNENATLPGVNFKKATWINWEKGPFYLFTVGTFGGILGWPHFGIEIPPRTARIQKYQLEIRQIEIKQVVPYIFLCIYVHSNLLFFWWGDGNKN